LQSTGHNTDSLELSTRVADGVLINGESLSEELVADLLEACLVGNFTTHHEQPERQVCTARVHPLVEIVDTLVHESIENGGLRLPVIVVVFTGL
jgi:hypothetical protein